MAKTSVTIIATGVANIASMRGAFHRLGCDTVLTQEPARVLEDLLVVLPGVGAFGAGMERLRGLGLDGAIRERVASGRSLLAVCLGLQLLCRSSEESPGVDGLSILDGDIERFRTTERIPQLGWNQVEAPADARYLRSGYAYFANSFCARSLKGVDVIAPATYGHPFVAACERGGLLACQFHPELSGAWGTSLLQRWITGA
jgi:imidazole glycerol phosphate synthase glutamine amidotransferase subunit